MADTIRVGLVNVPAIAQEEMFEIADAIELHSKEIPELNLKLDALRNRQVELLTKYPVLKIRRGW